jgi:hypothetical protein
VTEPATVRTFTDMVPLVRPNCETVQGLRRWAAARGNTQSLPILSPEEYAALGRREKRLYDACREVVNANLGILQTPMLLKVRDTMDDRIWANALNNSPGAREGIMINGGGAQGKTETVLAVVADFLSEWEDLHGLKNPTAYPGGRDAHEPVVYARVPSKPTPKTLCGAVLDAVGEDWELRESFGTLRRRAIRSLRELGTRVLVLDDITRIKMHRLDDQDVLDLIRDLMDTGATLILVGVGITSSGLLSEGTTDAPKRDPQASPSQRRGRAQPALNDATVSLPAPGQLRKRKVEDDDQYTQTERRFKLLHMGNFAFDTPEQKRDWVSFLAGMGAHVRLVGMDKDNPGRILTDGEMPEYLFRRTGGVVGTLCRLLDEACQAAIKNPDPETGVEPFSFELLDGIEANYSAEEGRVAEAGEIPFVPPAPASRAAPKAARGANSSMQERRPMRAETAAEQAG